MIKKWSTATTLEEGAGEFPTVGVKEEWTAELKIKVMQRNDQVLIGYFAWSLITTEETKEDKASNKGSFD